MTAILKSRVRPHTRRTKNRITYVRGHERHLDLHISVLTAIDDFSTGKIKPDKRWQDPAWQRQYYRSWLKLNESLKDISDKMIQEDSFYGNMAERKRDMEIVFAKRTGKYIGHTDTVKLTNKIRLNLYRGIIKTDKKLAKAQVKAKPILKQLAKVTKEIDSISFKMDNAEWKAQAKEWMKLNDSRQKVFEKRGKVRGRLMFLRAVEGEVERVEAQIREEMKSTAGWGTASTEDIIKYAKQYVSKNL